MLVEGRSMKRKKQQREAVMESFLLPMPYITALLGDRGRGIRNEEVKLSLESFGEKVLFKFLFHKLTVFILTGKN